MAVLIFRGLQQLNPAFTVQSGLEPYTFSVRLPPHLAGSHKRHWSEADSSREGDDDEDGSSGCGGGSAAAGMNPAAGGALGNGSRREDSGGQGKDNEMKRGGGGHADEDPTDGQGSRMQLVGGASSSEPVQTPGVQPWLRGGDGVLGSLTDAGAGAAARVWVQQAGGPSEVPAALAQHLKHHGLESAIQALTPYPGETPPSLRAS